jgi:hypothetical protein
MVFYFEITKNIQFLTRKFGKNNFCASLPFYSLCVVLLVNENLVSKYEQLLILTDIDGSTLHGRGGAKVTPPVSCCWCLRREAKVALQLMMRKD